MKIKAVSILSILILMMPFLVSAQTYGTSAEVRSTLLSQIERLTEEVSRLQALLSSRSFVSEYIPYHTVLFPLSFESKYLVQNSNLITIKGESSSVRSIDQKIFNLFKQVLGTGVVSTQVQEFRVFQNTGGDLGAFVERVPSGKWVVGVNRDGFDTNDQQSNEIFAELFVHEYAHILMSVSPDFAISFKNSFWTTFDNQHAVYTNNLPDSNKFYALNNYYEKNTDRFVSDYSTMNHEEDVAESFVSFVYGGVPTGSTTRDKKVLSFYKENTFTAARAELRNNLLKLSLLN